MNDIIQISVFIWPGMIALLLLIAVSKIKDKPNTPKPYIRWIVIFILSIIQTGCLGILSGLSTIGAGGKADYGFAIIFIIISMIWLIHNILSFKKINPANQKPEPDQFYSPIEQAEE